MSLKEEDRRILVELELEKAERTFSQVGALQREQYWDTLANRLYYSLFHQYYVKTGLFSEEEGSFYSQMETLREKSDYNCFFNVTEADIVSKVAPASSFIKKVKQYIVEHQ